MALTNRFQDEFLRNSALFFMASGLISALNYAYYPVLSRLLDLVEYGELQTVASLTLQTAAVFLALNMITVNLVANHSKTDAATVSLSFQKAISNFFLLLLVIALPFLPLLSSYFQFDSPLPLGAFMLVILTNIPTVFWMAYLQGRRDFIGSASLGILGSALKIAFAYLLVKMGWGVFGAILGIALGQLVALFAIKYGARRQLPKISQQFRRFNSHDLRVLRRYRSYILNVFIVSLTTMILFSIDVLYVKQGFSGEQAGLYGALATVARISFFATTPLAAVLLPSVTLHQDANQNLRTFAKSLALTSLLIFGLGIGFSLNPEFILRAVVGSNYTELASLLPKLVLAISVMAYLNLTLTYLVALSYRFSWLIGLSGLAVFGAGVALGAPLSFKELIGLLILSSGLPLLVATISIIKLSLSAKERP